MRFMQAKICASPLRVPYPAQTDGHIIPPSAAFGSAAENTFGKLRQRLAPLPYYEVGKVGAVLERLSHAVAHHNDNIAVLRGEAHLLR